MAYTSKQAVETVYEYLKIDKNEIKIIEDTNDRGFLYKLNGENCVIFIYPISCKKNNKQNFFDTRDSGVNQRKKAWNYAVKNNYKYFCLGVNSEQERYKDYIFSLESSEEQISNISFRKNNELGGTGTQVNIPANFIPSKKFERINTELNFSIAVINKEYILSYLEAFDNRPYLYFFKEEKTVVDKDISILNFLVEKLEKYYKEYSAGGTRLFGFEFYKYFEDNIKINDVINRSSLAGTQYTIEIDEGIKLRKLVNEKRLIDNFNRMVRSDRLEGGYNKIYYGIPGCGKSYQVYKDLKEKEVDENNIFRTTFYLDYSNSDFVGQLLPKTDEKGNVTYIPNFGPFSKALKRAYETDDMVYLVIEEINRGNAAAIFGDLFQLLDRLDKRKAKDRGNGSKEGDSEYPITNSFIQDYLGIEEGRVIIPSNLTILATMNTSDQNVFPLDTAFKRRWKMKRIVNDWDRHKFADWYIPFTDITWRSFVDGVNKKMVEPSDDDLILEDKQLGAYFVSKDMFVKEANCDVNKENKEKLEDFTNNVIEYLYNDVFKFDKGKLFENKKSFKEIWECINKYKDDEFDGSKNLCMNIKFDKSENSNK